MFYQIKSCKKESWKATSKYKNVKSGRQKPTVTLNFIFNQKNKKTKTSIFAVQESSLNIQHDTYLIMLSWYATEFKFYFDKHFIHTMLILIPL